MFEYLHGYEFQEAALTIEMYHFKTSRTLLENKEKMTL